MKKYFLPLFFLPVLLFSGQFKYNFAYDWSMPHDAKMFDEMKKLGFNYYVTGETGAKLDETFTLAKERGITVYLGMDFKAGGIFPDGSEQVISAADTKNMIKIKMKKIKTVDQVGGEPLDPDTVDANDFICFNREDVLVAAKEKVRALAAETRSEGISFDWFGYKNYYACFCDVCVEKEALYLKAHPELTAPEARSKFSEEAMLNFLNAVIAEGKKARPGLKFACHVYPYFKPNPLFGNKLNMEYPQQTVSWFFLPHWDLAKVRAHTKIVVQDAKKYFKAGIGIPFFGIYADSNKKSAARIAEEFKILKEEGAEGVAVASFGDILKDPEMIKVFEKELK